MRNGIQMRDRRVDQERDLMMLVVEVEVEAKMRMKRLVTPYIFITFRKI